VWLFTRQLLAPGDSIWSLFIATGIYLVEIVLLAGFAALLPWLKLKQPAVFLWGIAGAYAALVLTDLWTVGYYLSPALILALINAAYLSPEPDQFTRRNFLIFSGSGIVQFLFTLTPFLKRLIF
jgi:hypothetical protein